MSAYFLTGSGTDIGKTLVLCTLIGQCARRKMAVHAAKPVVSGYQPDDPTSDTARIAAALAAHGQAATHEAISPWRFAASLSPHMAAAREGQALDLATLVADSLGRASQSGVTLVEGVGGVMVPLNDRHTVLDWIERLRWPVLYVAGSYLGAISHGLTGIEVLRARGIAIARVIVSESEGSPVPFAETCETFAHRLAGVAPVVALPRLADAGAPWDTAPDLSAFVTEPI